MTLVFSRVIADVSVQFVDKFPAQFDFLALLQRICEDTGVNITVSDENYSLQGQWSPMERAHGMLASTLSVYSAAECVNQMRQEQEAAAAAAAASNSRPFSALVEAAEALSRGDELTEQVQNDLLKDNSLPHCVIIQQNQQHLQQPVISMQSVDASDEALPEVLASSVSSLVSMENVMGSQTQLHPSQVYMPLPPFETIHASRHGKADQSLVTTVTSAAASIDCNSHATENPKSDVKVESSQASGKVLHEEKNDSITDDNDVREVAEFQYTLLDHSTGQGWHHNESGESGTENNEELQDELQREEDQSHTVRNDLQKRTRGNNKVAPVESSMPVKKRGRARKQTETPTKSVTGPPKKGKKKKTAAQKKAVIPEINETEEDETPSSPVLELVLESPERRTRGRPKKSIEDTPTQADFSCSECDFVARTRNALCDHKHRIHLAKPTKCDTCEKVFPNARYMKRHRASHFKPQHCCDICGKMYKVLKALRDHRKKHDTGYKPPEYQCTICPKSFCTRYIMDCHMKSEHMGIKRSFLCSTCGKSFTTKHTLQQHANVHVGARPYPCEVCGKTFSYESALRDHKYIHAGTKKFVCRFCSKAFRQRSALKMHEKIHNDNKDFKCEECGRGFTQKQALQRHIRAHKGVKPFSCKLCGRTFGDASIIRRHMILVHKVHKDISSWREDIVSNVKENKDQNSIKTAEDVSVDSGGTADNGKVVEIEEKSKYESSEPQIPSIGLHGQFLPTAHVQEVPVPVPMFLERVYQSSVLPSVENEHQSSSIQQIDERHTTNSPYASNTQTPVPLEYTQMANSSINHYQQYPASTAESQHYQTIPRGSELVHVRVVDSELAQEQRHPVDSTRPLFVDQRILDSARLLEIPITERPVDATVPTSLTRNVEISVSHAGQAEPVETRDESEARVAEQGQINSDEINKRLQETENTENIALSNLYAYYANIASQYVNATQYANYVPNADSSGNQ